MAKNYYSYEGNRMQNNTCNSEGYLSECNHECKDSSYVVGNSLNFCINNCDNEIKADMTVDTRETVRVWGQIKDCDCNPVPYAYVKLAKVVDHELIGIAHTITDCLGYYQFDVCPCKDGFEFTLIVGKASVGQERVVSTGANCKNCCSSTQGLEECNCSKQR